MICKERTRWTPEKTKRVLELRAEKKTIRDISDVMACSTTTVQQCINALREFGHLSRKKEKTSETNHN